MKRTRYVYYSIIAACFFWLLSISWLKWGNLIVDTFRDPWVAYKITEGKVLYRDIHYLFGLLPPHLIAVLFKAFGVNLYWIIFVGILTTTAVSVLVYRISRLFLNREFSSLATLNFLFVFAFGGYAYSGIFNFILPYNIASTLFTASTLSGLYFFFKYVKRTRTLYLTAWLFSVYAAILSRLPLGIIVWSFFLAVSLIFAYKNRKWRIAVYSSFPLLAAIFSYALFLYAHGAFGGFKESVLDTLTFKGRGKWELYISGFDYLFINFLFSVKSFLYQSLAMLSLFVGNAILFFIGAKLTLKPRSILTYSMSALLSFAVTSFLLQFMYLFNQYRLMPILLIVGILVYGVRLFFPNEQWKKHFSLFTLFLVSLAVIARMSLTVSPTYYGFCFLTPGLVCYYIFLSIFLPSLFRKFIPVRSEHVMRHYLLSLAVFLAVWALLFSERNFSVYRVKNFVMNTPRGSFSSFSDNMTTRFWETVRFFMQDTPKNSTVVVFPEGPGINFFSTRDNPLRYFNFAPTQVHKIGEEKIIRDLDTYNIDYIVLLQRDMTEYGYPEFGVDYGVKIYSWILDNYLLEKTLGPFPFRPNDFGVAIFKRKR